MFLQPILTDSVCLNVFAELDVFLETFAWILVHGHNSDDVLFLPVDRVFHLLPGIPHVYTAVPVRSFQFEAETVEVSSTFVNVLCGERV